MINRQEVSNLLTCDRSVYLVNLFDDMRNNCGLPPLEFLIYLNVSIVLAGKISDQPEGVNQALEPVVIDPAARHPFGFIDQTAGDSSLTFQNLAQLIQHFLIHNSARSFSHDCLRFVEKIWRDDRLKRARLFDPHIGRITHESRLEPERDLVIDVTAHVLLARQNVMDDYMIPTMPPLRFCAAIVQNL